MTAPSHSWQPCEAWHPDSSLRVHTAWLRCSVSPAHPQKDDVCNKGSPAPGHLRSERLQFLRIQTQHQAAAHQPADAIARQRPAHVVSCHAVLAKLQAGGCCQKAVHHRCAVAVPQWHCDTTHLRPRQDQEARQREHQSSMKGTGCLHDPAVR